MKIFTDEQFRQLLDNGSQANEATDFYPVVKLYLSWTNCKWLISEIDPNDHDIAFCLGDLGFGYPELGYIDLRELKAIEQGLSKIECDPYFEAKFPISAYATAARENGFIVTDEDIVRRFNPKLNVN